MFEQVCNRTRSPSASLLFKGQATKYTTVEWPIDCKNGSRVVAYRDPQVILLTVSARPLEKRERGRGSNLKIVFLQASVWSLKGHSHQELVPVKHPTKVLVYMETSFKPLPWVLRLTNITNWASLKSCLKSCFRWRRYLKFYFIYFVLETMIQNHWLWFARPIFFLVFEVSCLSFFLHCSCPSKAFWTSVSHLYNSSIDNDEVS